MNKASSRSRPPRNSASESPQEAVIDPGSIRTVQMGPLTHKVDDGLETRKTIRDHVYPGTFPHLFKGLLALMIRPIHSLTHIPLS